MIRLLVATAVAALSCPVPADRPPAPQTEPVVIVDRPAAPPVDLPCRP